MNLVIFSSRYHQESSSSFFERLSFHTGRYQAMDVLSSEIQITFYTLYTISFLLHVTGLQSLIVVYRKDGKSVQYLYLINLCCGGVFRTIMNILGVAGKQNHGTIHMTLHLKHYYHLNENQGIYFRIFPQKIFVHQNTFSKPYF